MAGMETRLTRLKRFNRLLHRLFPERQIHLRTGGQVTYVKLSRGSQMSVLLLFLTVIGWTAFTSTSYVIHDRVLSSKDNQITNARLAYRSLLNEVSGYQKKFTSVTHDLEENHALMLGLVEQNTSLQQNLRSVKNKLGATEDEREKVIATSEYLKGQLKDIDEEMRSVTDHNDDLKENLEAIETDMQTALSERNQALFKSNRMRRNIAELETRLAGMQETEHEAVQRLTNGTLSFIESMQKVVKLTGLKVGKLLLADGAASEGQGGPFIEVKPDDLPAGQIKADLTALDGYLQHSEALQGVMSKLPLTAPLDSYRVTSSYGKRRDPINKRWAAHYGLDLGATFKAPVYATAPGVVTFVGWKGKYGKLIEIDHGAGIKTRYGHLHKTLVKKGQKINYRENIGQLGSTGRSTGAHLHYEIAFRGKARNPMKFIKAGRYVFQE